MPASSGPNTLGESNLVFAYDTGDVKNSYIGEPTTNLVSNKIVGDYGNAPGSSTTTISPDGTNNATIPIPDAIADRYEKAITGGTYSTGTQLTYSWHYKQLSTHAGSTPNELGGLYIAGLENCTLVGSKTKVADLSNDWTRWQATFQITDGSLVTRIRLYFGYVIGIGGSSAAYYGHQLEQKSHVTPFTTSTRSATQGLLPLVGNSTIDLTNVSFNSNAQMVFDGTNDYVDCGAIQPFDLSARNVTWEAVVKFNNTSGAEAIMTRWNNSTGEVWWFGRYDTTKIHVAFRIGGGYYGYYSDGNIGTSAGYYHVAVTLNSTVLSYYINGVLDSTDTVTAGTWTSDPDPNLLIGAQNQGAASNLNGEIPVAKIYNRALTTQEVRQNYQQYKTRFNLS
jgi:hypothetical protein